jgi:hypothetical protein
MSLPPFDVFLVNARIIHSQQMKTLTFQILTHSSSQLIRLYVTSEVIKKKTQRIKYRWVPETAVLKPWYRNSDTKKTQL